MADEHHLSILRKGVMAWNAWRAAHPAVTPDFSHATLEIIPGLVTYRDGTNAERKIGLEMAGSAEFRKLRSQAKQIEKFNKAPFVVVRDNNRDTQLNWRDLLAYVKGEGMRDANVQRYKGLGEMNAEQLWDTTMNPATRTLKLVTIDSSAEADRVFSMLMGDEVPPRRDFIESHAKYARIDA